MASMKPIEIVGFTPLNVILAERLSYTSADITLIEQTSNASIDTHWQSVSLLCLINLLKQCRILLSNNSKKFGINVENIKLNDKLLYAYLKSVTQQIQKYYLTLLKQRQVKFELFIDQIKKDKKMNSNSLNTYEFVDEKNIELKNFDYHSIELIEHNQNIQLSSEFPWTSYFSSSIYSLSDENCHNRIIFNYSSDSKFVQSPRLNLFHSIFQHLLQYPSLKLIGSDIFVFELAHLLISLGHNQIVLYRMNPNESSILSRTDTNTMLVTRFQNFSKFIHEPLIRTINYQTPLHIIEQFHQFKINIDAGGKLEYEKFLESPMPISRTSNESKKDQRTYLETTRQSTHKSTIKLATSNIQTHGTRINEEPLDNIFPPSSTFFVLIDVITPFDRKSQMQLSSLLIPNVIRTFNNTPGSLIFNIYETLRTISENRTIPHLKNIFLSVDCELCVLQNPISVQNGDFGTDRIIESQEQNLHDFYKIIERPVNPTGEMKLYESQLFQHDAIDLQSLLLLFNIDQKIPINELIFLFHNEYDWPHLLALPDCMTAKSKDNIQHNSV